MASLQTSLRHLRCRKPALGAQWLPLAARRAAASSIPRPLAVRTLATTAETTPAAGSDAAAAAADAPFTANEMQRQLEAIKIPHQGVKHARAVPVSPSYFSKTPKFNDLHIQLLRLSAKYSHLPLLAPNDAPVRPWRNLAGMREDLGETIKSSHFTQVMGLVRRLNCIEPSLAPAEVTTAVSGFTKAISSLINVSRTPTVDRFGRSVGVGRRKTSTARAFVVEGTGEILINGKPLNEAFGRVHDRESAVWALTCTGRMQKYNVWALVEGGGTTGQAEALTLAVAKGLLVHEPALKPALRKGKHAINLLIALYSYSF